MKNNGVITRFHDLSWGLFFIFLLSACGDAATSATVDKQAMPFFDVKTYFEEQIAKMKSVQPSILKKVTIGDQTEEKTISDIDFEKELKIFQDSDINRPTWLDKYTIDSIFEQGTLAAVAYTAIDTSLNTRFLKVSFLGQEVDTVRIRNQTHSPIADTRQDLQYCPNRSYAIYSTQKTIGRDARHISIEASWKE